MTPMGGGTPLPFPYDALSLNVRRDSGRARVWLVQPAPHPCTLREKVRCLLGGKSRRKRTPRDGPRRRIQDHLHPRSALQRQPPQPVELLRTENQAPAPTSPRDCCWRSLAWLPTPTSSSMLGPPCQFFVVALHTLPLLHSLPSTARLVGSYHC